MKKVICTIILIISLIIFPNIYIKCLNKYYDGKIDGVYYDEIGNLQDGLKNSGLELQKKSLDRSDNILIFGSSELSGTNFYTHPSNFLKNKVDGFQINIIGRGHYQDFVHAINFLALDDSIQNKKVVIILSPQWFDESGIKPEDFNMVFSPIQFYSVMFNKNIDKSSKLKITNRVKYLLSTTKDYNQDRLFCNLYSSNNFFSKASIDVLMPYYKFKYDLLTVKDKKNTYELFKKYKNKSQIIKADRKDINWNNELKKAENVGKKSCTNNDFGVYDEYYSKHLAPKMEYWKGLYRNGSYAVSPEYDDLTFLLDVCKKLNIKPLFISVPVNGLWYDYTGFPKEGREAYYKKVKDIIDPYGYKIADFSGSEYEKYFLGDIMHVGWKGWIKIDGEIEKYYYEK
ncbi:D-alanyl-lipoteichoic acid biosynthesis protein DltD [Clostridium tyrobutyricum]|jgi:D-alanine transfer protein|uniref:D-alanyl-lipoteichoic acid biosynthesis protein DltD n=1 Tax=Clostridium tyrobutyricum TaxID=1519 RepID=UPI000E838CFC|nr:D-alanyl-lipoteichoic acid biosynthesis protein DltD [Clostridium tyrobutyricum]HBF76366.1 D-alanyl-lipoteichoic acid biosynthesis protein DltD [Clostridiaceae bacterium]HBG37834.1 D-alanyl-lipoteichoic acid biosynthesis protein DltD [Clostridiaceae bacterium]HBN29182.1 D-alanyl-lipoteichoic acid biosynthesis protein DltD [Clostridiaceae bacterium]HCL49633.1 D-alanyl-lipoteichoic acid biosynthesis protein DltD [Clostridiaceae bacterium]